LIIKTSSNEGSTVLDCFCGSGTTLLAAQKNNRNWIGIDQSDLAIKAIRKKLASYDFDLFSSTESYDYQDLAMPSQIWIVCRRFSRLVFASDSKTGIVNLEWL
jgi:adenine specific DNA methylase Mod